MNGRVRGEKGEHSNFPDWRFLRFQLVISSTNQI